MKQVKSGIPEGVRELAMPSLSNVFFPNELVEMDGTDAYWLVVASRPRRISHLAYVVRTMNELELMPLLLEAPDEAAKRLMLTPDCVIRVLTKDDRGFLPLVEVRLPAPDVEVEESAPTEDSSIPVDGEGPSSSEVAE